MNGDATFGFCSSFVGTICLGFNLMGCVNNPTCWSCIPHQAEGKKTYKNTSDELQKAGISLLKDSTAKDCLFSSCIKDLLARLNVQKYSWGAIFCDGKLDIQTAQCDQLAGWSSFTQEVF
jgi:hypothetical protein